MFTYSIDNLKPSENLALQNRQWIQILSTFCATHLIQNNGEPDLLHHRDVLVVRVFWHKIAIISTVSLLGNIKPRFKVFKAALCLRKIKLEQNKALNLIKEEKLCIFWCWSSDAIYFESVQVSGEDYVKLYSSSSLQGN